MQNERPLKPAQVAAILKRDNYTCQKCGKCGVSGRTDDDLQVHHKKRRTHGGANTPDNLTTLCTKCHRREHPPRISPRGGGDKSLACKIDKATYADAKKRLDAEGKTITEYLIECMNAKAVEPIREARQVTELELSKHIDRSRFTLWQMRNAGKLDGLFEVKNDGRVIYDLARSVAFFADKPKAASGKKGVKNNRRRAPTLVRDSQSDEIPY